MWMIGIYYMGTIPMAILGVPLAMYQLIFLEGNGIVCFDACGPCSNFGYQYILVNDECVLPSEESCKLLRTQGDWKFDEWTCQPVCKEPYSDICKQEMIMEKIQESVIKNCQPEIESSVSSPSILYGNGTHYFDGNTCEWYESD